MLVLAIVIVWVAAAALFWVAFTGLQLRFAIARRKHAPALPLLPDEKGVQDAQSTIKSGRSLSEGSRVEFRVVTDDKSRETAADVMGI